MKEVYLIRHAQTVMNIERRFSGILDCELDVSGYEQLKELKEKMKQFKIDQCYCSPLKRTVLTAESFFNNPVKVHDLHEMNFGDIEGMKFTEVEEKFPGLSKSLVNEREDTHFPNGESQREFDKRVNNVFSEIVSKDKNSSIAIVSHSCVIRQIISNALAKDNSMAWKIHVGNCSITKLEVHKNNTVLAFLNK